MLVPEMRARGKEVGCYFSELDPKTRNVHFVCCQCSMLGCWAWGSGREGTCFEHQSSRFEKFQEHPVDQPKSDERPLDLP